MRFNNFTEVEVWKESLRLAKTVYKITKNKYFAEDFALRNQIRKSVVSISSNIAEGVERSNNNESIYFLRIAKGSSGELRSQLYLAREIEYITLEELKAIDCECLSISSQIGKFVSYLSGKRKAKEFCLLTR